MPITCSKQIKCDSILSSLILDNLAIYSSVYSTSIQSDSSSSILSWANLNSQAIQELEGTRRVWQFQGSGYSNSKVVTITYSFTSKYNLFFQGQVSGTLSSSSQSTTINASTSATIKGTTNRGTVFVTLTLKIANTAGWQYFSYNIYKLENEFSNPTISALVGINTAGYDQGGSATQGYACIANAQIDWLQQGQMTILRMPILPIRVLKSLPNNETVYNLDLFTTAFTDGSGDSNNTCDVDNGYYPPATYMSAVKYALSKGLSVIIDAHDNSKHLDTYGTTMTPENFINWWRLVATFIQDQVSSSYWPQIQFELFNEPVGNIIHAEGQTPQEAWNNDYVIPTIKEIQKIIPHAIILATTFGNYSGMHSWVDDGTLPALIASLQYAGYTSTSNNNIIIAGHQYCDTDYSGTGNNGCDPSAFNSNLWNQWIQKTDNALDGFNWFLSEGNPKCSTSNCPNVNLWIHYLDDCLLTFPKFLGFTVWMSNTGDDFGGTNMGVGPTSAEQRQYPNYILPGFYQPNASKTNYQFQNQFLSK